METIGTMNRPSLCLAAALVVAGVLGSGPTSAQDLARGAELYELCAQCHMENGAGNATRLAPAIAGLDEWYVLAQLKNYKAGLRGLHHQDTAGLRMYPMSLTLKDEESMQAVAAYVASMPRPETESLVAGGDPARGQQIYALCASCHGVDGAGNQAVNAPRLQGASDWYLVSSLQRYKAGIRGYSPENANASVMRGMSATLADDQAILDVVAYITTLSPPEGER